MIKTRSSAQLKAERKHDKKRITLPRFGGRCSFEEKEQLARLKDRYKLSEKEIIFKAVSFFELNHLR